MFINLAYVSQLENEDLASDYIFTNQRESHSRYGFFCYTFNCLVPFAVIEHRFTKINFAIILMEVVTIPAFLVASSIFICTTP